MTVTEIRKVLITPDPVHPGWWRAHGRDLLAAAGRIPSVAGERDGIAFQEEFAGEVRAALIGAGYRITDAPARTDPATGTPGRPGTYSHRVFVSDLDDLTVVPTRIETTPGVYAPNPAGHWQDESDTCPRCNPMHTDTSVKDAAVAAMRVTIAAIDARAAAVRAAAKPVGP